jgi:hypothetical protein
MRQIFSLVLTGLIMVAGPAVSSTHARSLTAGVAGGFGGLNYLGSPERQSLPIVGGYLDAEITPFLGMEGSLEYAWESGSARRHLAFYTTAKYRMASSVFRFTPYVGAGAGWHRRSWEEEEEDDFGFHFLGGVDLRLTGVTLGIVGRYGAIFSEDVTPEFYTVGARIGYPLSLL